MANKFYLIFQNMTPFEIHVQSKKKTKKKTTKKQKKKKNKKKKQKIVDSDPPSLFMRNEEKIQYPS